MTKVCGSCNHSFEIRKDDIDFLGRVVPRINGQSLTIPEPTLCPSCRRQRRFAFRNERNLYRRKCSFSGKPLISVYSPDKLYRIYSQEDWWGDQWDALEYGRCFDPQASFFRQFQELRTEVPFKALTVVNCENCDFNNNLNGSKNCYLTFGSAKCQDCYYCTASISLTDCLDVWWSAQIELSVGIFSSDGLYSCLYCQRCSGSNNLILCQGCVGCSNCLGCCNLVQKQYCIFNVQYSKDEYEKNLQHFNHGSFKQIRNLEEQVREFFLSQPHKEYMGNFAEKCSGDMLYRSRNCDHCFTIAECEDCSYLFECARIQSCYDLNYCYDCSGRVYEAISSVFCSESAFLADCQECSDSYYLSECYRCRHCFGCAGLRNAEYCILNKQFSQVEYEELLPQIIKQMQQRGEWGEFFPMVISPFGYNETDADHYYPLSVEEARKGGYSWCDYQAPDPEIKSLIAAEDLPDHISDVKDDILGVGIRCSESGRPFRITSAELKYYRRHRLPLPRKHPDQRFRDMLKLRNPSILYGRQCFKCQKEISTTYHPERPEKIYCEDCYREEVF